MSIKRNQFFDYFLFLEIINQRIQRHFEQQKEYICCKKGCSLCCSQGDYPCSELEYEYLVLGYGTLPVDLQNEIADKIQKIEKEKENFEGENFSYRCPFLVDDACSVYEFRPIICRTFGLPYFDDKAEGNKLKVPFCVKKGLNYSKVYDKNTQKFETELFQKYGYKQEPLAYNLSLNFLIKEAGEGGMKLDFGEIKSLIDWF